MVKSGGIPRSRNSKRLWIAIAGIFVGVAGVAGLVSHILLENSDRIAGFASQGLGAIAAPQTTGSGTLMTPDGPVTENSKKAEKLSRVAQFVDAYIRLLGHPQWVFSVEETKYVQMDAGKIAMVWDNGPCNPIEVWINPRTGRIQGSVMGYGKCTTDGSAYMDSPQKTVAYPNERHCDSHNKMWGEFFCTFKPR